MELLNNNEYYFLRCIHSKPIRADLLAKKLKVSDSDLNAMIYGNLSDYIHVYSTSDESGYNTVEILPIGKAVVDAKKLETQRWRVPLIVSIFATMIATLSLVLTLVTQLC